jgi:hypothetical protein
MVQVYKTETHSPKVCDALHGKVPAPFSTCQKTPSPRAHSKETRQDKNCGWGSHLHTFSHHMHAGTDLCGKACFHPHTYERIGKKSTGRTSLLPRMLAVTRLILWLPAQSKESRMSMLAHVCQPSSFLCELLFSFFSLALLP